MDLREEIAEIYGQGYGHGHNDTVESMFTDGEEQARDYYDDGDFSDIEAQIINKVLDAAVEAVEGEKLVDSTGSEPDVAYGNAILDALRAIQRLKEGK